MNKNALFVFIALALCTPFSTHAAFTFSRVGQSGDAGYSHSTGNSPTYREAYWNGISVDPNTGDFNGGPYYGLSPNSATVCNDAVVRSGLPDTNDTYCVYEGYDQDASWGSGDLGSGSGGGSTSGGNSYSLIKLSIYQTPIQPHSVAQMQSQLNAYGTYNFWQLYGSQYGAPQPPYASDPGYRDACPVMNLDDPNSAGVYGGAGTPPSNKSCDVYHHNAVVNQKPVATLTANPTTVVSGSSSLLTYSCSNNATAASIDNGVGSVTPVAAGSRSVAPGATTTYTLTCTNAGGSSTATATVAVTPPLAASCSVAPSSTTTGANVTWTGTASGGTGAYTYAWSGTDGLSGSSASVSKSYSTAGSKTGSVTVTSGSQSLTAACPSPVTITAPVSPDLSAGGVSPSSATAGTALTLSATIANTGTGSTGAGFTDLFQRATDSSGTGATDIGTYNNAALGASGSNSASLSYTFSSAGTYYVRACADKSSAGSAGTIAESNESNNCGPWSPVTVATAVQPVPTCSFSASPSTVPSTLTWSSTNATSCTGGGFSTGNATSGSVSVNTVGAYTLSCTGSGGSCSASVNVGGGACTAPTGTITANPTRVKSGSSSTITYSATGITTSCTVTGPGVNQTIPANSCTVPGSSVSTGALTTQSVYILTCDGVERGRVVVNVLPKIIEF